jgi:ATP-dependent Zn protease
LKATAIRLGIDVSNGAIEQRQVEEAQPLVNQLFQQLSKEAENLVAQHWSAIALVAKVLIKKRELTASDFDELIARTIPQRTCGPAG